MLAHPAEEALPAATGPGAAPAVDVGDVAMPQLHQVVDHHAGTPVVVVRHRVHPRHLDLAGHHHHRYLPRRFGDDILVQHRPRQDQPVGAQL